MKNIYLGLFIIIMHSSASVFASDRQTNEFPSYIKPNESHRLLHSRVYSTEHEASRAFTTIDDFTKIPEHMQTQDIKSFVMVPALTIKTGLLNGKRHMFDYDVQMDVKMLFHDLGMMKDEIEYQAVRKVRFERIYTNTNLVELEEQRNQQIAMQQAEKVQEQTPVKNNCRCIVS